MLNLEELKQAIEHDQARRWPDAPRGPDFDAARRLVLDAVLELEGVNLEPFSAAQPVPAMVERLDKAVAKLHAAQRALIYTERKPQ